MGANMTPDVIRLLRKAGCRYVRPGKGDHQIWFSPINGHTFPVDSAIKSRDLANRVLKQAGFSKKHF